MNPLITAIFIIGYIAIAFEHPIKVNKTASALLQESYAGAFILSAATIKRLFLQNSMNISGK